MGKLTRSAGRVLGAGSWCWPGPGLLVLAGAGIASAQPASTSANACEDLRDGRPALTQRSAKHPGAVGPVATAATELTQAASTGSPAVKSTVSTFVADLQADVAARRVISRPKLVADGNAIVAACSHRRHRPAARPPRAAAARPASRIPPCSAWAGPSSWPAPASSAWPGVTGHGPARVTASGRAGPNARPAMTAWTKNRLVAIVTGVALIAAGGSVLGLAVAAQQHAPQPGPAQAGSIGPVLISPDGSGERAASQACSSRAAAPSRPRRRRGVPGPRRRKAPRWPGRCPSRSGSPPSGSTPGSCTSDSTPTAPSRCRPSTTPRSPTRRPGTSTRRPRASWGRPSSRATWTR